MDEKMFRIWWRTNSEIQKLDEETKKKLKPLFLDCWQYCIEKVQMECSDDISDEDWENGDLSDEEYENSKKI